jgi:hypothetical protein
MGDHEELRWRMRLGGDYGREPWQGQALPLP